MIFTNYISEVLLFKETVRSNLHSANISESLVFTEKLSHNFHNLTIIETLKLKDKLTLSGTYTLDIEETIHLKEHIVRTVFFCDVSESLGIVETLSRDNIVDHLHITETLTCDVWKKITDTLTITEDLTYIAHRVLHVNETLNLHETVTCHVVCDTRPCIVGPATNTKTITLSSLDGRYSVTVRSPDFGNVEGMQYTRVNKKTRGGDLIVFRDPEWPKTVVFTYPWSTLTYKERSALMNFVINTVGEVVNLLDYEGNNKLVYIRNPDAEFAIPDRHQNHVKLEFEEK